MFLSYQQASNRGAFLVLRTTGDPAQVAAALRSTVRSVDPNLPAANIATMEHLVERTLAQPVFLATLLTGFSALAAVLALVGIYSVLSFSVARRVREIGVRMALGAERRDVVCLILRQSLSLVGAGLVAGCVLAALLSRTMRAMLHSVEPGDPATLGGMAALIAVAALAASYAPAPRASLVDPVVALRND
ncbi:MAG: FtsX-like permease family protein [Acidobacteria bacterium]|nr:FtsX-like permease family protein [Acidobacteriota bacterium]